MAGIFDFLGGGSSGVPMSPEQAKALELYRAGQASIPQAAPPQGAPLAIGSDPVAVQQQSRINPNVGERTFYTNSAGQTGTQVPKGSATAGVYDEVAEAGAKGSKGLFGTAARILSGAPATGIQAALYSGDAGDKSDELSPAQREAIYPGSAADAQKYAQHIQGLAKSAASAPAGGGTADMDSPEDAAAARTVLEAAQPPVENTPAGPAVQANPVTQQQAAAKTAQDTEVKRQTLEQGALKGLSTGAVSRPKMAEAVVEADVARSGKQLTPEAKQRAVTAELTNMKSMDNSDLSKYISYALIAGGVLAVLFDKSGKAADNFNQAFNRQLDRNLQAGIQNQKNAFAQAKLNQEMNIQNGKFQRDDRGLDIKEKTADNQGIYQKGQLQLGEGRLGLAQASEARQASQGAQGLGLRAQGLGLQQQALKLRQANDDRDYELDLRRVGQGDTSNAIRAAKVAQGKAPPPGVPLTDKMAPKVVDQFAQSQGIELDANSKAALASQIQQASKNNPKWATDPNGVINDLLNNGGYESETDPGIPFVPFTGGGSRIRQKKQQ